jgi:hypothetical protein
MNGQLRDVLDRADSWPQQAQEELRRAALAIERALDKTPPSQPTLRDVMLKAPLDGIDLERRSTYPPVRNVDL